MASSAVLVTASLAAQGAGSHAGSGTTGVATFPTPDTITFARIHSAERGRDVAVEQVRDVLEQDDGAGNPHYVSVRERLHVSPAAGPVPNFDLQFVDVVGQQITAGDRARRLQSYQQGAGFLYRHATLVVHEPSLAARNYFLTHLSRAVRLGRPVQRIALLPRVADRSAWMLDLDVETGYPLYRAEYSPTGQLVSALTVTSFRFGQDARQVAPSAWWSPRNRVREFASYADARATLPNADFVDPTVAAMPSGYEASIVRTIHDDISLETSLVTVFCDGLDEFFVSQTLNAREPNVLLPPPGSTQTPHAIYRFHDLSNLQLVFHDRGVRFLVLGRSVLTPDLERLTTDLLRAKLR